MAGGRPRKIETPEIMWSHFEKYVKKAKSTPILVHDFVGKDGDSVRREKERPLTFEGFCNYLEDENIISTPEHYFINWENRYNDFLSICSRIKRVIKQDQVEGGMSGIYNPSITQRLNGLVDKKEIDHKGELKIPTIPDIGNRK